jgi:hypothetical protein
MATTLGDTAVAVAVQLGDCGSACTTGTAVFEALLVEALEVSPVPRSEPEELDVAEGDDVVLDSARIAA